VEAESGVDQVFYRGELAMETRLRNNQRKVLGTEKQQRLKEKLEQTNAFNNGGHQNNHRRVASNCRSAQRGTQSSQLLCRIRQISGARGEEIHLNRGGGAAAANPWCVQQRQGRRNWRGGTIRLITRDVQEEVVGVGGGRMEGRLRSRLG
jgi:hypothetical protein